MKKYWKFNLHLCQEQLINVKVSQFSSCFSWDDWFCESYTSHTRITIHVSNRASIRHSIAFSDLQSSSSKKEKFNCWHVHTLRSVFVNSPPPKPKLSSRISLQNQLFCLCRLPAVYISYVIWCIDCIYIIHGYCLRIYNLFWEL